MFFSLYFMKESFWATAKSNTAKKTTSSEGKGQAVAYVHSHIISNNFCVAD